MIKNYFKVAFRSLIRQKFYAFINILGLTVGLTTSFLIILYVADELSYDQFHEKADKIHRVILKGRMSGNEFEGCYTCSPMASAVVEELPEIQEAVRIAIWSDMLITYEEDSYTEKKLLLADSNFFKFFTFDLIAGNPDEVLKEPNSIVLTGSAAKKYFGYEGTGDDKPLGKMLNVGTGEWLHKVTGIVKDPPANSHFHFDLVMTMESWDYSKRTQWTNNSLITYVAIDDYENYKAVEQKFEGLVHKYVGPEVQQFLGISLDQFAEQGGAYGYFLQPLKSIHLHSDLQDELEPTGGIIYVYLLSAIAAFIIIIACINFMNLATARSASRAKEVGIRKTAGAGRRRLVFQFLIESMLYSLIAVLLSLGVIYLVLPFFNVIAGKELAFSTLFKTEILSGLVAVMLTVGLLAGSYPAFYLTSFNPAQVLKGKVVAGMKSGLIRSILVVIQFTVSIGLIICTLLIYRQLNYVQNRNLGFDRENVLIIQNCRGLGDQKNTFQEELIELNDVVNASIANDYPPHIGSNSVHRPIGEDMEDRLFFQYYADENHQKTVGFEIKEGRFFNDMPSDSLAIVINETAARLIGWDDPIGQKIGEFNQPGTPMTYHEVVGVIGDFNYATLKEEIQPLIIFHQSDWGNLMGVRLTPGNIKDKIRIVENKWKEFTPDSPFEYSFLDENFDALYRQEQRLGTIFMIFTILAILVASLGLLGLATFTAEQRSKEIGIRKAMGASVFNVILLLSRDYTRLVIISFLLSVPASYFIMDWWLENFAYKINLGWISFVVGGLMALILSWITVSYQSYKAASVNPVDSLRYE